VNNFLIMKTCFKHFNCIPFVKVCGFPPFTWIKKILENSSQTSWATIWQLSYGADTIVIYLFVSFEHQCCSHCLNMNVICLFILFRHKCCMSTHVVYTRKLCTRLPYLNNAQHSCLNNTNLWNNIFHTNLVLTHEACNFMMLFYLNFAYVNFFSTWSAFKLFNALPKLFINVFSCNKIMIKDCKVKLVYCHNELMKIL
jgi:hypothetical protein